MALDTAFYLVTKEIAIRSGLIDVRYRTLDNRFILDNKDLSRVRFTTDEYVNGLDGVEKITETEAQTLIAKGGYKKGLMADNSPTTNGSANEAPVVEEANNKQEEQVQESNNDNTGGATETITSGDVGNVEDVLGDLINKEENNETKEE